ncbi:MAG: serine/threonine protein kinase, partial [Planctomycetia bacterium]
MPTPTPEEFWNLLAASQLVPADTLDRLRRGYAHEAPGGPPVADDAAATTALAKWLVQRGVVTKWQGRRLLAGESGPFFVGDYRLLERLENDGPGRLFRCRHEPSGRGVCLMVLDRRLCQRVDVWTEVVRRTTIAHVAVDPMLSRTWALEQAQGNRFIVCEDVEGVSLADELARGGPLEPADACRLMLPVFMAVAELHRRGAVHGSLSLDALRRESAAAGQEQSGGRLRLLQTPLVGDPHAVPAQPPVDATERVSRLGRRASFVAPELMLPGRFSDQRSDVYALGCMLHALLTGTPPCWQGNAQSTLSQAAFVGPPPLGPPQVPVPVATLVSYLVARDPANRYPNAAEAADALAGCLGMPPVSGALPAAQQPVATAIDPAGAPSVRTGQPVVATAVAPVVTPLATVLPTAARKRAARIRMIGLGVAGGVVALALGIALTRGRPDQAGSAAQQNDGRRSQETAEPVEREPIKRERKDDGASLASSPAERSPPGGPQAPGSQVKIVDSDSLPWASPTAGKPPTLAYLPPGSQLVLLARPAEVMADAEGRQFVRALGPRVAEGIALLGRLCDCGLEGIAEVQAGWQAAGGESGKEAGEVLCGWAVWLKEPSPLADDADARERGWGRTTQKESAGDTLHVGSTVCYWLPSAAAGRVLVMAPLQLLEATVKATLDAGPEDGDSLVASLPQDLQTLVGMLDRSRHLTLLGSPHYLQTDGRPLMAGPLARLVEPLGPVFGDGVRAAALSR